MNCVKRTMALKRRCLNLRNVNNYLAQISYSTVKPTLKINCGGTVVTKRFYHRFINDNYKFVALHSKCLHGSNVLCQGTLFLPYRVMSHVPSYYQLLTDNRLHYSTSSGDAKKQDVTCDSSLNSCDVGKCGTPTTATSPAGEKIKISDPIITDDKLDCDVVEKKLSLFQKFKEMYRDYWYVLLPVHCVTSVFWFGGFYFLSESGVDIVSILEYIGINEKLIEPFRNGNSHVKAGYIAVAFALYKIATPLRYTVTLGGTTVAINYLKRSGYIKPIPKKEQLKAMYQEQKDILMEKRQQLKSNMFQHLKEVNSNTSSTKRK